jgi:hypothetical protein
MSVDEILRFDGAVAHDPRVAAWFAVADPLRFAVRGWWEHIRTCGDDVLELFHDGCPVALVEDAPFAYVNAFSTHMSVGFYHGASLPDPARLLEGTGKRMRHVKLRPGEKADVDALDGLIEAAYHDIRQRLGLA